MSEALMSMGNRANGRDKRALDFIENVTTNAYEVQAQVLSAILTRNANTEYLKRYSLNGKTDRRPQRIYRERRERERERERGVICAKLKYERGVSIRGGVLRSIMSCKEHGSCIDLKSGICSLYVFFRALHSDYVRPTKFSKKLSIHERIWLEKPYKL
jgi:hypothetical protein